jgi:1,4-dihydroxy-6-naphthoate synthase
MTYTIGISPCPNDIFIFEAIINNRIDCGEYTFDFIIEDVEYLNKAAMAHAIDVSKLSYFTYTKLADTYNLLRSGGALGYNCGPLLLSASKEIEIHPKIKIGIPGYNTTANFLLGLAYPNLQNKVELLFSDIEDALLRKEIDLGLVIHESRFTYASRGLHKVLDLGEYWQETTGSPIPLGCIAVQKKYGLDTARDIQDIIKRSVIYAFENPEVGAPTVKAYAQEMADDVIQAHINLYVNEFSIDIGTEGEKSINTFLSKVHSVAQP